MKPVVYLLACAGAIFFAACSSQSKTEKESTPTLMKDSVVATDRVQRMQPSEVEETISYKGKTYTSTIVRLPDETLPLVKNEEGTRFADNRVFFRLKCGGKTIVDEAYTKESFSSLVNAQLLRSALLEGIVFDKTTDEGLLFAASVGYPDSDLYQPIRLVVTPAGKVSMLKEEIMEELPNQEIAEEEK